VKKSWGTPGARDAARLQKPDSAFKKLGSEDLHLSNMFVFLFNYLLIENMTHTGNIVDRIPLHIGVLPEHVGRRINERLVDSATAMAPWMSVDVITGSAPAYLEALNRALLSKRRRGRT
jgi:hypothetical protein